jgi:tRNA-dihydrouridine synthase 2
LTKFCVAQFKSTYVKLTKAEGRKIKEALSRAKSYDDLAAMVGPWTGKDELEEIATALEARTQRGYKDREDEGTGVEESLTCTPMGTMNPEPPGPGAPLGPSNGRFPLPALVSGHDAVTPTPTQMPREVPTVHRAYHISSNII